MIEPKIGEEPLNEKTRAKSGGNTVGTIDRDYLSRSICHEANVRICQLCSASNSKLKDKNISQISL